MRFFFYCSILLVFLSGLPASATVYLSLEQCIEKGVQNNASLNASRYRTDAAAEDLRIARADFFPSISSSFTANQLGAIHSKGPTDTDYLDQKIHSANIKLTQILFAGSRLVNSYDKANFLKQASLAELELNQMELIFNIESTFYKVIKAKKDVVVNQEAVDRLTKDVKAAEAFFSKELIPYVDVLSAKVDLANAESQLSVAKNEANRQSMALFALMNEPMTQGTEFKDTIPSSLDSQPQFDTCLQFAQKHRPDLQSLELQRQAAFKQSSIAMGKYLPTVRLEGGYYDSDKDYNALGLSDDNTYYDRDQRNRYWMVGVTATWQLFDGGKAWYEKKKANSDALRFASLLKEAHNTIATGIQKALFSLAEAKERHQGATKALSAAEENYTAEKNRLTAGVSPITALLDAQNRLVRAQVNVSNASLDYALALSELKYMTGGMVFASH